MEISIHTPARGVTAYGAIYAGAPDYFNPHSRTGSDLPIRSHDDMGFDFNPHSRTGSDLPPKLLGANGIHFNPHSRTGSDV